MPVATGCGLANSIKASKNVEIKLRNSTDCVGAPFSIAMHHTTLLVLRTNQIDHRINVSVYSVQKKTIVRSFSLDILLHQKLQDDLWPTDTKT